MYRVLIKLPTHLNLESGGESAENNTYPDPKVQWALFKNEHLKSADLSLLSQIATQLPKSGVEKIQVLVVVPGEEVLLTQVNVPSLRARYLQKALPYLLEEQLIDAVDAYFFAHQKQDKAQVRIAAVDHQRMRTWLELMKQVCLPVDVMLVDSNLAPSEPDQVTIALDDQTAYLNAGVGLTSVFPANQLPFYFKVVQAELDAKQRQAQATIDVNTSSHGVGAQSPDQNQSKIGVAVRLLYLKKDKTLGQRVKCHINALKCLDQNLDVEAQYLPKALNTLIFEQAISQVKSKKAFNLLQQDYQPARKKIDLDKRLVQIGALIVVSFVLFCANLGLEGYYFNKAAEAQKAKNVAYYRELFPNDRRVQRIRSQMQAKINRLGKTSDSRTFLHYYQIIGESLVKERGEATSDLDLRRMVYDRRKEEFRLDVFVRDFPYLDALKNSLEAKRLLVRIDNANKDGERIKARLRIKRA